MEEDTVYSRPDAFDILGTKIWKGNSSSFELEKGPILPISFWLMRSTERCPKPSPPCLRPWKSGSFDRGRNLPAKTSVYCYATQNPIEMEGTYPLPEAQMDRFIMKLSSGISKRRKRV